MNVQEVEARMVARISGLEDQENKLQQWLECLRRLDGIATEWNVELLEKNAIETVTEEVPTQAEELEVVSESLRPVHEESVAEEERQLAEDPFDQLRRKLVRKSEHKSKPVFNSGLLFGTRA